MRWETGEARNERLTYQTVVNACIVIREKQSESLSNLLCESQGLQFLCVPFGKRKLARGYNGETRERTVNIYLAFESDNFNGFWASHKVPKHGLAGNVRSAYA